MTARKESARLERLARAARNERICELRHAGLVPKQIAGEVGLNPSTVCKVLRSSGVPRSRIFRAPDSLRQKIARMLANGASQGAAAKANGVSKRAVSKWISEGLI